MSNSMQLDGVFVGRPQRLGGTRGVPVESAIVKTHVTRQSLVLARENLEGDQQADLTVHGGLDKAVYAYPAEHYRAWQAEGVDVTVGGVGENLSLRGTDERSARIGSIWSWGDALLQITQPRSPCFKLTLRTGRKDVGPRLLESGRCGWYLRVLTTGSVPTSGEIRLVDEGGSAPTVAEALAAMFGSGDGVLVDRVLATPALASQWRTALARKRLSR